MLLGRLRLDGAAGGAVGDCCRATIGLALGAGGARIGTTGDGRRRLRRTGAVRQGS